MSDSTNSSDPRLDKEDELAIIFTFIVIVCLVLLGLILWYIRRTSKRQLDQVERDLQKERDRRRFEKERERRELTKGSYEEPNAKRTDVFVIYNGMKGGTDELPRVREDGLYEKQTFTNPSFTHGDEEWTADEKT